MSGAAATTLLLGDPASIPRWCPVLGQLLVGSAIGSAINPGVLRDVRKILPPGSLCRPGDDPRGRGVWPRDRDQRNVEPDRCRLRDGARWRPGMVAAATALDGDGAVIAGMHVVQLLAVLSSLPLLIRWAQRWEPRYRGCKRPRVKPLS